MRLVAFRKLFKENFVESNSGHNIIARAHQGWIAAMRTSFRTPSLGGSRPAARDDCHTSRRPRVHKVVSCATRGGGGPALHIIEGFYPVQPVRRTATNIWNLPDEFRPVVHAGLLPRYPYLSIH